MNLEQVGKGSVFGALIGDAAGATLEFLGRKPKRSDVKHALQMVGGGCWRTAPGQITDDGEMALCLMHSLVASDMFNIERVAQGYLRWYQSLPFDIGRTTSNGLSGGLKRPHGQIHQGMWRSAERYNRGSKANGSLMRVAPLGVWSYRLSEADVVDAACKDSRLTHCNLTCQHACAVYCAAIRHLMHNPKDAEGAFEIALDWSRNLGNKEIQAWLSSADRNEDVGYWPRSGFVKYGFTHAFRHLKSQTSYLNALFETLLGGGDTDTNACIVGGLLGAYHGVEDIPEFMKTAILTCDTQKGRPRPEFLQTRVQLPALIGRLIE